MDHQSPSGSVDDIAERRKLSLWLAQQRLNAVVLRAGWLPTEELIVLDGRIAAMNELIWIAQAHLAALDDNGRAQAIPPPS